MLRNIVKKSLSQATRHGQSNPKIVVGSSLSMGLFKPLKAHYAKKTTDSAEKGLTPAIDKPNLIHSISENPEPKRSSALLLALKNQQLEQAQKLLHQGIGIEAKDEQGNSILHLAALRGYWQLIPDILAKGIDIDSPNRQGHTPLQIAIQAHQPECIDKLIACSPLEKAQQDKIALLSHLAMHNLIIRWQTRLEAARPLLIQAIQLEAQSKSDGLKARLDTLHELRGFERLAQERAILQQAIQLLETQHEADPQHLLVAYTHLADIYTDLSGLENVDQAFVYLHKALALCEKNWGKDDARTAQVREKIATAQQELLETWFVFDTPVAESDNNPSPKL